MSETFYYLPKGFNVKLLMLTEIPVEDANKIIKNIMPINFKVHLIRYEPSRRYFTSAERFGALKKHIDFNNHFHKFARTH